MSIYKGKGSRNEISNYRPVSVTNSISKIFEKVLLTFIQPKIEILLIPKQHGFRSAQSTESNLLDTYTYILENLDNRKNTDVIYLDLSKAFDRVPQNRLVQKLSSYNLEPNLIGTIKSFLSDRTMNVKIDGIRSSLFNVGSGVP